MATAEQIKALLRSFAERDEQRFYSIALQVAAKEARQGHYKLADDIKDLVTKSQKRNAPPLRAISPLNAPNRIKGELNGLLELTHTSVKLNDLVLSDNIRSHLDRVLIEQTQKDRLAKYDLVPRRKLLFTGYPGTGKTTSAAALATELKLPLYTIVLDSLITRYMGETAAKLRLIFDHILNTRAVYLFDEFDAIGTQRGAQNDVGEIRRVLNSFLLFVEQDHSESIIIAATNHPELLDKALYRRFDDILLYEKPTREQIKLLIENRLSMFDIGYLEWDFITKVGCGLSSAEVTRASEDAAKEAILSRHASITSDLLIRALKYRQTGKQKNK